MNDLVINKIQSIQRCVHRAREELKATPESFEQNFTHQDAALLNILRGCEQAIDLANYLVKHYKLGIPNSSGESFDLLQQAKIIPPDLTAKLHKMVHFRNTLVHHYQQIDLAIVKNIITFGLDDLITFGDYIHRFYNP